MDNFLRKIKLLDHITIELNTHKTDFIKNFRDQVDDSDLSLSDSFFETLISSDNYYKGNIDDRVFRLRRRRKLFDTNSNFAISEGKMIEKSDKLILETDIKGFHTFMKLFYFFLIGIYSLVIIGLLLSFYNGKNTIPLFILPFLGIHALFMLGIPYFIMRRSVSRMKYELERDFNFWMK